jgi:hypothetical protein
MKFTTLTSTLVLSLFVASSETIAMEIEEQKDTATISVTQQADEQITESDLLTQSMCNPDIINRMMIAIDLKDQEGLKKAANELKQNALLRKQEKSSPPIPTVDSLTKEETKVVSWFSRWFSNPEKTEEKIESNSQIVSSLTEPAENTTDEGKTQSNTPVIPVEEQSEKMETSDGFYLFNPFRWFWGTEPKLEETLTLSETSTSTEAVETKTEAKSEDKDLGKVD